MGLTDELLPVLKKLKLGAQVGTTSYTAAKDQIAPTTEVAVYDTNDLAVQALKNKQVDGIVLASSNARPELIQQIQGANVPVVIIPGELGDFDIDLLMTDYAMPRMNGGKLAEAGQG